MVNSPDLTEEILNLKSGVIETTSWISLDRVMFAVVSADKPNVNTLHISASETADIENLDAKSIRGMTEFFIAMIGSMTRPLTVNVFWHLSIVTS